MTKRTPENRGLVTAVCIFAIAVLAGSAWITRQLNSQTPPSILQPIAPIMPSFRQAPSQSPNPDGKRIDADSRFLNRHRSAGAIVGYPVILRGDKLAIGNEQFRLVDIQEIAGYRHCGPSPARWPCGTTPAEALRLRIGEKPVACYNRGYNVYGEQLGQCFVDSIDLGGWMIEHGMALPAAERMDYAIKRNFARNQGRGWWHTQKR